MKYKNILIIVFLIVFQSQYVNAQNIEKGFKYMSEKNFDKASSIFIKAVDKGKDVIAAKYGLAVLLSDKAYYHYNLTTAFRNIRYAKKSSERLSQKQIKHYNDKYGITLQKIDDLFNEVANSVFEDIKKDNSIEKYDWYIQVFNGANSQVSKAIKLRDKLAFEKAEKINTFRAYQDFVMRYPESDLTEEANKRFEKIWKGIYEQYYSELELYDIKKFNNQYPDYPFFDELSEKREKLAEYAYKLNFYRGYNPAYEENYIEFINNAAPTELAFVAVLKRLSPYLVAKDWDGGVELMRDYKDKFPDHAKRIEGIIKILKKDDKEVEIIRLSEKINTKYYEYAPVITTDGRWLYFCGRNKPENLGFEDIFVAEKVGGEWTEASLLPNLNTAYNNEAPLSISPDGNMLLLYYDSDIYFSKKKSYGWTNKKRFPMINTGASWEADAIISADGNAIFFISDRPGGVGAHHEHENPFHGSLSGNSDIYVSIKTDEGWGKPINLGTTINTPFAERSPYLHPDMKTLYFSSDGHNSLGRLDVFKTTRLNDSSWTNWSEPINLGKSINTHGDEYNYRITTDGKLAYFSKFEKKNADICYINLPEEHQPEPIATISGYVSNNKKQLLDAEIRWEDLSLGEPLGYLQNDPLTGAYFITLPMGKNYGYFVDKPGYYPVSGNIDLTKQKKSIHIKRDIVLISIDEILNNEIAIPLSNVFFDYDKSNLKPESFSELNRLANFIKKNQGIYIEISGHTDNSGNTEYNKKLSDLRAKAVKNYLIEQGCNESNLNAVGYGKDKPIADNTTAEGRAENRRVEFKVIKK